MSQSSTNGFEKVLKFAPFLMVAIFVGLLVMKPQMADRSGDPQPRQPSAVEKGAQVEYPGGHSSSEKEELWHLSEGADVFPLRWFLNIESLEDPNNPTYLYQNLDKKFGVIEVGDIPKEGTSYAYPAKQHYPMKWVGLTLAMSEPASSLQEEKDIMLEPGEPKPLEDAQAVGVLREIDKRGAEQVSGSLFGGKVQIPMVGTNCAFCHSGLIKFKGGHSAFVEGAPNMLNVRKFFSDMVASTFATMLIKEKMVRYLNRLHETGTRTGNPKKFGRQARKFVRNFKRSLKGMVQLADGEFDEKGWKNFKKIVKDKTNGKSLDEKELITKLLDDPANRPVVEMYIRKFMALSYNVPEQQFIETPALAQRAKWLAKVLTNSGGLATTPEGYARTDAFGRISNAVARGAHRIPLVAPVSFPPMWGMQYTNLFHYNGNTNSVIMRNIGQSFGLGALLLDNNYGATSNIKNLARLEKLIYQIEYPEWNKLAPKGERIHAGDTRIKRGCEVYVQNCKGCHDSDGRRVGPNQRLVWNKVVALKKIKTDKNHATIQPTPVVKKDGTNVAFRKALFALTKKVKDEYVSRLGVNDSMMAEWENRDIRGKEHFRDTYLGETFKDSWLADTFGIRDAEIEELAYMKISKNTHGYIAKHLSGVWATAPYLHNGSVPTIMDLITPPSQKQRPAQFQVGCRGYDSNKLGYVSTVNEFIQFRCSPNEETLFNANHKLEHPIVVNGLTYASLYGNGNSNQGHENYIDNASDREALITFLKVLRPDPEYSWQDSKELYKINEDNTCSLIQ